MKLADLPQPVFDELCHDEKWRLDIDPGFDSKHEFWMVWRHFLLLPEDPLPIMKPAKMIWLSLSILKDTTFSCP